MIYILLSMSDYIYPAMKEWHLERMRNQDPVPFLYPHLPFTQVMYLTFYQAIGYKATLCIFNDLLLLPLRPACKHVSGEN